MAERCLVDTDVLVDVARGTQATADLLDSATHKHALCISTVTEMELIVGCRNKAELSQLDAFLTAYERMPLSPAISDIATDLLRRFRLSHAVSIPDSLIAATALANDCQLLTGNLKHFQAIPELRLMSYR